MGIYSTITGLISAHNPTRPIDDGSGSGYGWRPPIWGNASSDPTGSKARYCLVYQDILSNKTSNGAGTGAINENVPGSDAPVIARQNAVSIPDTVYNVFDAVFTGTYESNLRITDYPVQSGQIYSYNAVLEPIRICLEVGMSDTMQSYIPGTFTGNESRSVAAFQLLEYIQTNRIFCTLNTRWGNFPAMLIENLRLLDNNQTFASARFVVAFRQVQIASVANIVLSTRPQVTQQTNGGTANSQDAPQSVLDSNEVQETTPVNGDASVKALTDNGNRVPLASGDISSNKISSLPDYWASM